MLEEEDAVVFRRQVLQFVPLTSLETLQALILPVLLTQLFLGGILNFVLELEFILTSHLHLYTFSSFFCLFTFGLIFPIGF